MSNGTHRIASGTRFAGALRGTGDVLVEGAAEGTITLDGALDCAATATCALDVEATTVRIAGSFTGTIDARARVELLASARVAANVRTPTFVMAEGAVFRGQLEMPEPSAPAPARAPAPAPRTVAPAPPASATPKNDPPAPEPAPNPPEPEAVTPAEATATATEAKPAAKTTKRRTARGAKS